VSGSSVRTRLLDAGFAVLALDAQCHGERVAENDYALPNPYVPAEGAARRGSFTLQDIYVQTVVDYRRALDFLESRGDIDAERIGALGYSMGGTQLFPLLAVEPRVRAAVACVVPAEGDKWSVLAPQNYRRRVADRPLLMLMGREDPMCSLEQARALFEFMEGPAIRLVFFDAGHKLPTDYAGPATEWLIEHLTRRKLAPHAAENE
jgi:dienelactone hydrolase